MVFQGKKCFEEIGGETNGHRDIDCLKSQLDPEHQNSLDAYSYGLKERERKMQMTDQQTKNVLAQTLKNRADMDDLEIVDLTFKMKNTARDKDNKRDDQQLA